MTWQEYVCRGVVVPYSSSLRKSLDKVKKCCWGKSWRVLVGCHNKIFVLVRHDTEDFATVINVIDACIFFYGMMNKSD